MEQLEHGENVDDGREQDILARLGAAPGNVSILLELQAYYKEQARYEDEVSILMQLMEKDLSPDERAEALCDLAYALYRHGNLEEAILRAEDLLDTYPDYRYLGSVFWLLGVMHGERSAWQEHLEIWRQDVEAAERNLRKALDYVDDEQERAGVLVELGEALSSKGRLEEAKLYYEQSVLVHLEQPSSSRALAYVDLARLCREQGDIDQAEQYIQQARHVLDGSNLNRASVALGSIYEELGDIAFQKSEYQRAADNYEAALEEVQLPEKKDELYYKLSVTLRWDGQYARALEFLRQALALGLSSEPTNEEHIGELLFHMGQCAYSLRDYQQAIVLFEKTTEKVKPPVLAEVHLCLGHSYFRLKRFKKAAECYRKVIRKARFLSLDWREAVRYFVWAQTAR